MAETAPLAPEETLDPEDWEAMRQLGHRMVDDMLAYLGTLRNRPVWQNPPGEVRAHFNAPMPLEPQPAGAVYEEFLQLVLPYALGNAHPRFWAWVPGTGTVFSAFTELLAATINVNTGGGDNNSAYFVERQVVNWCKQVLGFPEQASGILTSGCSSSSLVGLAVARNTKAGTTCAARESAPPAGRWCSTPRRRRTAPSRRRWRCWDSAATLSAWCPRARTSPWTWALSSRPSRLTGLVSNSPELELVAPVSLNVVCFRYLAPGPDEPALDALNRQLLIELQERGLVAPSGSTVRGKYILHVAITNHRSRREDFELLVRETLRLGRALADAGSC